MSQTREKRQRRKKTSRSNASRKANYALLLAIVHAAPVDEEAGDRSGRGQKLGDADVLVRGVRHVHVPGAVHHARHAPEVYKDAHVGTVGDAFHGWRLARHPLVGILYGLADRGVRLDFGGGELAAEPLELRRMLA